MPLLPIPSQSLPSNTHPLSFFLPFTPIYTHAKVHTHTHTYSAILIKYLHQSIRKCHFIIFQVFTINAVVFLTCTISDNMSTFLKMVSQKPGIPFISAHMTVHTMTHSTRPKTFCSQICFKLQHRQTHTSKQTETD